MPYVTTMQSPIYHQVSLDEMLDGYVDPSRFDPVTNSISGTRTVWRDRLPPQFVERFELPKLTRALLAFNEKYAELWERPRESLYYHFEIPKNSIDPETGKPKMRPIDAPEPELKAALYELKAILENTGVALYHTSAFAYVKKRCAVNSVQRHQGNVSHWFLKTDFTNFFGSTTEEWAHHMLSMIFPYSELYQNPTSKEALERTLNLCFLNGGLPQGAPISPMLTNLLMIPVDHKLANSLNNYGRQHYVYTRYADDILISSKYEFNAGVLVDYLNSVLAEFEAPFNINPDKTRYASGNGHNFNLGVILNERNEITVGRKTKEHFRAKVHEYVSYRGTDLAWTVQEIQQLQGVLSYYTSVEPIYFERYLTKFKQRYHIELKDMILSDLAA